MHPLLAPGRTRVMGVVNVTPDSFSDGGHYLARDAAIAHGRRLAAEGADILDVGGESTRPGAHTVSVAEECERVIGVIETLAGEGHAVSIDTVNAVTAHAAIQAGAIMVNDVSGSLRDPQMPRVIAESGVLYVAQHTRGTPETMSTLATYDDVVVSVVRELRERMNALAEAGVSGGRIVLDPGLGFAKNNQHNWEILARLDEIESLGFPVLVGASRKRFLAGILQPERSTDPRERDAATTALTALLARRGVWGVRVHSVTAARDAIRAVEAWREAAEKAGVEL
ncbi:MAG: dihydropteroate synthase [Ruaniaceae bacterium]|nr:dihydropteroate synthase [Ruaniaceae bacterium]